VGSWGAMRKVQRDENGEPGPDEKPDGLPDNDSNPRFGTPSRTCPPLEILDARAGRAAVPARSWHTRFEYNGCPG